MSCKEALPTISAVRGPLGLDAAWLQRGILAFCRAGIEDLREKREEIIKQLREDDAEKAKITQELQILTKRLAQVNESIARKVRGRTDSFAFLGIWHASCILHTGG